MSEAHHVPPDIVARLRVIGDQLPEAYEEHARDFHRWRIRGSTLANVRVQETDRGPATVLTFHSRGDEHDALLAMGHPFYPGWGPGLVAMVLTEDGFTDWTEVRELLTESYCLIAPKKLIARLGELRPD